MTRKRWALFSALAFIPVALFVACESEDSPPGTGTPTATTGGAATGTASGTGAGIGGSGANGGTGHGGSGAGTGAGPTGGTGQGGLPFPTDEAECQGHVYECGDLLDNDNDGRTDYQDPDCLGPCDDTENSYFGGIPGQSGPSCDVDCYFDQDSGHGNDDCYWDHRCDPISVAPNYYPEPWLGDTCEYLGPDHEVTPIHKTCEVLLNQNGQSQACLDYCLPLTPNGCDCFGCCELPAGSGEFVWLGSEGLDDHNPTECTAAEISNPDICHPCTPVTDCWNDCGICELCLGKTVLPPECFPGSGGSGSGGNGAGGAPGQRCEPGVQPCGLPGDPACPSGYFCITGCCIEVPT